MLVLVISVSGVRAGSAREPLRQGNRLFADGEYLDAVNKYNEALIEQPQALEPKFNKANSYYRLDDLGEAIDLYEEVATGSKDMALVAKAKYNLGNCFFQRGSKQRDSDLQEAIDDMKTSIIYWRQVLDADPANTKARRNIEVARLTIKDIMDQLKKQQEQQRNQQQQGQQEQQEQDQQQQGQQDQQQQEQQQAQQDPNQPQDAAQPQDPNQAQDQQQPEQQQQQQGDRQQQQQMAVPDAKAQEIIDQEQRQKEEREILRTGRYRDVERDW